MNEASKENIVPCCDWKQRYLQLEQRVATMQKEMDALKDKLRKEAKEVRSHCQHFYKSESDAKIELNKVKVKLETLGNIVIRLDEQLQESNTKLVELQARSMRKNLLISGIPEVKDESSDQLLHAIKDFLSDKLKIEQEVPLKVFHRLNYVDGSGYRPVVIKLIDINQKSLLLSHGPHLKGQKNDKDKYYYLNEQLPDKLAEDKRYAQLWIRDNKQKPTGEQMQMKIHRNKLRVNNQPYTKKIKPPSPAEIIRLEDDDLATTQRAPTVYGFSRLVQGSEFISYAVKIASVEDVRVAYRKLRIKYADATHIMSAYRLNPPNGPFNQEGDDDGEYGAARAMLDMLQRNRIVNVAIFIVRFYGGKKIGVERFDVIRELSLIALQKVGAVVATNQSPSRRQTRSMSVRGGRNSKSGSRPKEIHQSTTQRDDRVDLSTAFADLNLPQTSMYRPTPINSPAVSPTQMFQAIVADVSDDENSALSQEESEYDDPGSEPTSRFSSPTRPSRSNTDGEDGF